MKPQKICLLLIVLLLNNATFANKTDYYDSIVDQQKQILIDNILPDLQSVMTVDELNLFNSIVIDFSDDFRDTPYSEISPNDSVPRIVFSEGFLFLLNQVNINGTYSTHSDNTEEYYEYIYEELLKNLNNKNMKIVLTQLPQFHEWLKEELVFNLFGENQEKSTLQDMTTWNNKSSLSIILAHEFAHHFLKHLSERKSFLGKEIEADEYGFELAMRAGYQPIGVFHLFRFYVRIQDLMNSSNVKSKGLCRMSRIGLMASLVMHYQDKVLVRRKVKQMDTIFLNSIYDQLQLLSQSGCDTSSIFKKFNNLELELESMIRLEMAFDTLLIREDPKQFKDFFDVVCGKLVHDYPQNGIVRQFQSQLVAYCLEELIESELELDIVSKVLDQLKKNQYWSPFARSHFLVISAQFHLKKFTQTIMPGHIVLAENDIKSAIQLDTQYADSNLYYAIFLGKDRKFKESEAQLKIALSKLKFNQKKKIQTIDTLLNLVQDNKEAFALLCYRYIMNI